MLWKVLLICLIFLSAAGLVYSFDTKAETEIQIPLKSFPFQVGSWQAAEDLKLDGNVAAILGVDDYIFRNYYPSEGSAINLYASYFASNNRNKGFHSPLNCMPGAGWKIVGEEEVSLKLQPGAESVTLKKLLLQKGSQQQLALYWYQCRSRIIASEYWERIYRVLDSIRYSRTDGAFIRLTMPLKGQNHHQALQELKSFAVQIIPHLEEHLPGV